MGHWHRPVEDQKEGTLMPNIVVTGTFKVSVNDPSTGYGRREVRITRVQLTNLFTILGWNMMDAVTYGTTRVYAANPSGRSSKIVSAVDHGVPVSSYDQLYMDMSQGLAHLNGGVHIRPELALQRLDRYGHSGWRTNPAVQQAVQQVASMPGGAAIQHGSSVTVRMTYNRIKPGDMVRCLVTEADVVEGNLYEVERVGERTGGVIVIDAEGENYYLTSKEYEPAANFTKALAEGGKKAKALEPARPGQTGIMRKVKL